MRIKYLIIAAFVGLLSLVVTRMMKIEHRIRSEKIRYVPVIDKDKPLMQSLSGDKLREISENCDYYFISGSEYFKVLETSLEDGNPVNKWNTMFLRGVNIGAALPGKFPTEFAPTFDDYLEWLKLIGEMNANVIRTYTILPPEFYQALAVHNMRNSSRKLYLFQGIWTELPPNDNFYNNDFIYSFQEEIIKAVDLIHGKAVLPVRPGHAHGIYSTDISRYVAGILLGREWEPLAVEKTNRLNQQTSFSGNFVTVHHGNPMEVWLAQMIDFTVQYETQTYKAQRPVTFVNWLPLDPMFHNSEYIEAEYVREYDNDLENLDFRHFHNTDLYKPGIFASYHVYPYYPDFIYNEKKYNSLVNRQGEKDNFYAYLTDLKEHCKGMPLLISEYGLPSSRGNSHYTPFHFDQGGHSEKEQAELSVKLTRDIYETGCAGAVYFEWIDEWFKYNWLVMDYELPAENRRLWHNMENPEQNYGIYAYESRTRTIDGKTIDWPDFKPGNDWEVSFGADPGYFYIVTSLPDFDFGKNKLYIGIDVYDKEKGDHKLPFPTEELDNGIEYLAEFRDEKYANLMVDEYYTIFTDRGKGIIPGYTSVNNSNGKFIDQLILANRARHSVTGEKYPEVRHNRGLLSFGNSSLPSTSNADWYYDQKSGILEARFSWQILNVTDPSTRSVLDKKPGSGEINISETGGFHFYFFITDKNNKVLKTLPVRFYSWDKWQEPLYQRRLKPLYYSLQKEFKELPPVSVPEKSREIKPYFSIPVYKNAAKGTVSFIFREVTGQTVDSVLHCLDAFNGKASFVLNDNMHGNVKIPSIPLSLIKRIYSSGHEIIYYTGPFSFNAGDSFFYGIKAAKSEIENSAGIKIRSLFINNSMTGTPSSGMFEKCGTDRFVSGQQVLLPGESYKLQPIQQLEDYFMIDSLLNKYTDWEQLDIEKVVDILPAGSIKNRPANIVTIEQLYRLVRIFRNNGYWISTPSEISQYRQLTGHAVIKTSTYKEMIFATLEAAKTTANSNVPVTVIFYSPAKKIRVSNSADDGIYNVRNGEVELEFYPGREVTIETLEL